MEPGSGEDERGFQNSHPRQAAAPLLGESERMNGEGRPHEDHDGEQPVTAIHTSPAVPESEQELANRTGPERPGEDEFESFHRSFTIGANALDSLAARAAYGPFQNSSNAPDPMATIAPPSPAPVNSPGRGTQPPPPQQPPSQPPSQQQLPTPPPSQQKEDPTVAQARRSMMRRTGDRHARGKLPEPKEGRFLPPDCLPLEPQIPAPRSSKRYMKHKQRSPDVFEGNVRTEDTMPLEDDEHVVSCRGCNLDVVVKKAAVVVRCKNCGKVNPASSVDRFDGSHFTPS